MHKEAEETRIRADQEQDEKSTLKLLDVAKDLDAEVEKLYEAADRLLAESAQLEEYLRETSSVEVPRGDTADKAYIRRMRQSSGVST
jgi:predicted nuclease with TOPRIM domain